MAPVALTSENFDENFLRALSDDCIQEKLSTIFEPIISLAIIEKINKINTNRQNMVSTLLFEICATNLKLKSDTVDKVQQENVDLKQEICNLKKTNDILEQLTCKDNLVISGIPASFAERAGGADP